MTNNQSLTISKKTAITSNTYRIKTGDVNHWSLSAFEQAIHKFRTLFISITWVMFMLRKNPTGHYPEVSSEAYIDNTAIVCGKVIIEDNVFIGPYAVIRADEIDDNGEMEPITIRRDSNIQDGVVIHSKAGARVTVGERTSIAHRSIIHGPCEIGDDVFIGFNTVVFNSTINNGCVVRHNSVIDGHDIPEKFHVPSMTQIGPGFDLSSIPHVAPEYASFSESVVAANHYLVQGYKKLANEF